MEAINKPRFDTGNLDICDCECHNNPKKVDLVPCGTMCSICKACIKIGLMKTHLEREHQPKFEKINVDLVAEDRRIQKIIEQSRIKT